MYPMPLSKNERDRLARLMEKARPLRDRSRELQRQSKSLQKLVREQHYELTLLQVGCNIDSPFRSVE